MCTVTNVTIKNVNFVKGNIDGNTSALARKLVVTNCNFDGVDSSLGYAITVRHGTSLEITSSTAKNYAVGMLYVPQNVTAITVKDVKVENVQAAFNITYSGDATFENVTLNNVGYGIHFKIYGSRTYTVRNCDLEGATNPFWFWDESNNTEKVTVVFEGDNNLGTKSIAVKAGELKLAEGATLTAAEGLTIGTDVADHKVVYETGVYSLKEMVYVAQVGDAKFETFAEAFETATAGDTIVLLADCEETATTGVVCSKGVTLDLNGKKFTTKHFFTTNGTNYIIDRGTSAGALIVPVNDVVFQSDSEYMPIYDTTVGGYRFFTYELVYRGTKNATANYAKFGYAIEFDNAEAYAVLAETTCSKFNAILTLSWEGALAPIPYRFADEVIQKYAIGMAAGKTMALTLGVNGIESVGSVNLTFSVDSDKGVDGTSITNTYPQE